MESRQSRLQVVYITLNVLCVSFKIGYTTLNIFRVNFKFCTISEAGLQAGTHALLNVTPLLAVPHISFFADWVRI